MAAIAILAGAHSISVGFDQEPGECRWSIVRIDGRVLRADILSFGDLWGNQPDNEGTPLLFFICTPLEFGKAVQKAAQAVLKKHGSTGYKVQWGHDFPLRELDLLNAHVATWEQG